VAIQLPFSAKKNGIPKRRATDACSRKPTAIRGAGRSCGHRKIFPPSGNARTVRPKMRSVL
jgi:hypothetical protein